MMGKFLSNPASAKLICQDFFQKIKIFVYSAMVFLLLHIAIMAPPYVQGGGIGPNVYDKLNVASMGKVTKNFWKKYDS